MCVTLQSVRENEENYLIKTMSFDRKLFLEQKLKNVNKPKPFFRTFFLFLNRENPGKEVEQKIFNLSSSFNRFKHTTERRKQTKKYLFLIRGFRWKISSYLYSPDFSTSVFVSPVFWIQIKRQKVSRLSASFTRRNNKDRNAVFTMPVFSVFILRNEMIPIPAYSARSLSLAFSFSFVVVWDDGVDCREVYELSNLKFMLQEASSL